MMTGMKAIIVCDDRSLAWEDVPDPTIGDDEVLVEVHATAQNRADLSQRAGHYPPPPGASEILGLEMAGVVREVGPDVRSWGPGDSVCALLPGGGYAELVSVPAAMLMPVPRGWTMHEAAAMPEAFYTAFLNLFLEASLATGETVLVHGGASGVGTAAIQLAREASCEVLATAGQARKVDRCLELGAAAAVNYRERDFATVFRDHVGAHGIDVILDMVGAEYFERNVDLLATGGRLVFISTLGGRTAELDIRQLMAKRAMLKGSTLRARPLAEKTRIRDAFMGRFWDALEAGRSRPIIDRVLPIAAVEEGHEAMRNNENIGKIVLEVVRQARTATKK
jgi:putative PIG3 family NAD(P)H quinone oxidoreductase